MLPTHSLHISRPSRRRSTALLAAGLLSLLGFSGFSMAQSQQQVLRVSAIPDEAPTELQRKFKPLGAYLEKKTGMKVEFIPSQITPHQLKA